MQSLLASPKLDLLKVQVFAVNRTGQRSVPASLAVRWPTMKPIASRSRLQFVSVDLFLQHSSEMAKRRNSRLLDRSHKAIVVGKQIGPVA